MRRNGGATRGRAARMVAVLATIGAALAVPGIAAASQADNSGPHSVDLKVKKYAVPSTVGPDATSVTWKIVVTNKGGRDLTDVKVDDPGVTLGAPVSAIDCEGDDDHSSDSSSKSSSKSSHSSDHHSSCTDKPDVLQPGESWTYTVTQAITRPEKCGTLTNTVKVTATAPKYSDDSKESESGHKSGGTYTSSKKDNSNDHHVVGTQTVTATATATAYVACPAFEVTKKAEKASYAKGETITWIVTVKNTGNVPLSPPVLSDTGVVFGPPTSDRAAVTVSKSSKRMKRSAAKTSTSRDESASTCGSGSTYSSKSSSEGCPPPPACEATKSSKSTTSSDDHCDAPKPCPDASKSSMSATSSDDHCDAPKPCPDASKSSMSTSSSDDHCDAPKPPVCTEATSAHSKYKHQSSDDHHACPPPAGGSVAPGETLTYRGTQTASTCGTVTNVVTVTTTALPPGGKKAKRKHHRRGEYTSSSSKGMKHDSSMRRSSSYGGSYGTKPPTAGATLTKTSDPATTFVVCQVTVTKTAALSYTKTYSWTVTKALAPGTPAEIHVAADNAATTVPAGYVITATKDAGADSNAGLTGTITVGNPYPTPLDVTVSDDVLGVTGESCTLTPATLTVPAGASADVSYTCTLPSVPTADTKNSATATFTVNGQPGSVTGSVAVGEGTVTKVNDTVTVTDTLQAPAPAAPSTITLGTTSATVTFPTVTRDLGVPASGSACIPYVNTAKAETSGLQPKAGAPVFSAPVTVSVCKDTTTPGGPPTGGLGTPPPPPATIPGTGGVVSGTGTTPRTPRPRLVVTKKGPAAAVAGQLVRYTITVRNAGKVTAKGVKLRDILPGGFAVAKRVKGASVSGGAVKWSVGTLASGRSRTVSVSIRLARTVSGRRSNVATATASNASTARGQQCTRIAAIAGALDPAVTG